MHSTLPSIAHLNGRDADERVERVVECLICGLHEEPLEVYAEGFEQGITAQDALPEGIQDHQVPTHPVPLRPHPGEHKPDRAILGSSRALLSANQIICLFI